jgi:hypothetical protein
MEPWVVVLVAVALVVLAIASVYLLRRRRAGTVLIVKPDGKIGHRKP